MTANDDDAQEKEMKMKLFKFFTLFHEASFKNCQMARNVPGTSASQDPALEYFQIPLLTKHFFSPHKGAT